MVDGTLKPALSARELLEVPLGRPSATGLQVGAELRYPISDLAYFFARVRLTIRIDGQVDDAQVHAKRVHRLNFVRFRHLDDDEQVENAILQDEVGLAAYNSLPRLVVSAGEEGHSDTAVDCHERSAVMTLPGEDALVVDHRAVLIEPWYSCIIELVRIADLGYSSYGELSREAEFLSDGVIYFLLQSHLVRGPDAECSHGDEVTCFVEPLHRLRQGGLLLLVRQQLDLVGKEHGGMVCIRALFDLAYQ